MRILIVTEKAGKNPHWLDGGASLLSTMKCQDASWDVMQFGDMNSHMADKVFAYPHQTANRFQRRIKNAPFVATKVCEAAPGYDCIIFVHVAMLFGISRVNLPARIRLICMPMFLTPSYVLGGEDVPDTYQQLERVSLLLLDDVITPSRLEKAQLLDDYDVSEHKIKVVPRGINQSVFEPVSRHGDGPIRFCSIGSIKPQKNTLALVEQFKRIVAKHPQSELLHIGPIQDHAYASKVIQLVSDLGLRHKIVFVGYQTKQQISLLIKKCHIHLSLSGCETFGRTIFETLACGIPNVVMRHANASYDYLIHKPYVHYIDHVDDCVKAVDSLMVHYAQRSSFACEIHHLYQDKLLGRLLRAFVLNHKQMIISDFDGTLYHKNSLQDTESMMAYFRSFGTKVICSARSHGDLVDLNQRYQLKADWIISYSGAVIADGQGQVVRLDEIDHMCIKDMDALGASVEKVMYGDKVVQLKTPHPSPDHLSLRQEIYMDGTYIVSASTSKLSAIVWLLNSIDWDGQVTAWGDGPYDEEWVRYFDGVLINANVIEQMRIYHD